MDPIAREPEVIGMDSANGGGMTAWHTRATRSRSTQQASNHQKAAATLTHNNK